MLDLHALEEDRARDGASRRDLDLSEVQVSLFGDEVDQEGGRQDRCREPSVAVASKPGGACGQAA